MVKTRLMNKKDFSRKGLIKIIKRDISEISSLPNDDIISLWSFFKFLITDMDEKEEPIAFVTQENSIIYRFKDILERKYNIKIIGMKKLIAG
jgi:hypothetical protein